MSGVAAGAGWIGVGVGGVVAPSAGPTAAGSRRALALDGRPTAMTRARMKARPRTPRGVLGQRERGKGERKHL